MCVCVWHLNQLRCLAAVTKHVSGVVQCEVYDILIMLVFAAVE